MKGKYSSKIQIFFLLIFVVAAIFLHFWQNRANPIHLILKDKELSVMVAKTVAQKYKGLGGRADLGGYDGMIFVFDQYDRVGIVMRDMQFPCDIVWFKNGEVVDIAPSVPLEHGVSVQKLKVYYPRQAANSVLELGAGWAAANGLRIGDKLQVVEK